MFQNSLKKVLSSVTAFIVGKYVLVPDGSNCLIKLCRLVLMCHKYQLWH